MKLPRIMIAAPGSGSGKTMMTCAILQALKESGCRPVSSKCGPDYIDPMFHEAVLGVPSNNLDLYFCSRELIRSLLADHGKEADLAVLEGVMGYYDGQSMDSLKGSSYEVAKVTQTPVLLAVRCRGMALSLAAVLKGIVEFQKDSRIAGILLNGISPMLYPRMKEMLEKELKIPVVGYLPVLDDLSIESRHLGLVTPKEILDLKEQMALLGAKARETIDLEKIRSIAQTAPDLRAEELSEGTGKREKRIRIAVAKDRAFGFYYADNLKFLKRSGCELLTFSPLKDHRIPEDVDGIYIGGGYPEVYAKELSENAEMRKEMQRVLGMGMPCIAECGGFMYLHDQMEGEDGIQYPMCGVIEGTAFRTGHLVHFGYATLTSNRSHTYQRTGETLKAHEFHYWDSTDSGESYHAVKPDGKRHWECVHVRGSLFAGYPHLHFYANREFAARFIRVCGEKETK